MIVKYLLSLSLLLNKCFLQKPPKKRVKRPTKDAISSKTKKESKKLLKESRENLDSESDDYDADIDAPSFEVE